MAAGEPAMQQQIHTLYQEHHRWLCSWLYRRLGCSQRAADLTQDTFVRILAVQNKYGELDLREPRAYLRTIAHGLVVDYFRRCSLESAYLEALAVLPEPTAASPEEREIILEALHRVDAMLDRLTPRVRTVFLMSQLEGLTYIEIGERLGISSRTVKRDMQQGFAQCLALML